MPRKTSQAVKKDTAAAETKAETPAPRRSGRAVKHEPSPAKDASRSRRSSTAAQTAASVADSRSPRARGSSPTELPATRVKSVRRISVRVNYKESDGEEEAATSAAAPPPKFDENFESGGEEFEESDSGDEKSKPRGSKGRAAKAPARGAKAKKGASARGRRGRPSKKKDEVEEVEQNETVEVSDDSNEEASAPKRAGRAAAPATASSRPARSRRQVAEVVEVKPAAETKSRRSSGRAAASREESARKRPSRSSVQAKRYTEDEVEEIVDDADEKQSGDARKRKRASSPVEANKRLKETEASAEAVEDKEKEEADAEDPEEVEPPAEKEEPMDVDELDSSKASDEKSVDLKKKDEKEEEVAKAEEDSEGDEMKTEVPAAKEAEVTKEKIESKEPPAPLKETTSPAKADKVEKAETAKDATPVTDSGYLSGGASQELAPPIKEAPHAQKEKSSTPEKRTPIGTNPTPERKTIAADAKESCQPVKATTEAVPKAAEPAVQAAVPEKKAESIPPLHVAAAREAKTASEAPAAATPVPVVVPPLSTTTDSSLNGGEQSAAPQSSKSDAPPAATPSPAVLDHPETVAPRENGAHNDVQHTNSVPPDVQYYTLPGRKYVANGKLPDHVRQSVKEQTFGFVSYNLASPSIDLYGTKDKLLSELNKLDAHIICLQQVSKHFYSTVLEPSLDALGFKSIFSQPDDTLKGMATFYKTSLFRLCTKLDFSLKHLIEKEIEGSSLMSAEKVAVKSQLRKCGNALFTIFGTTVGTRTVSVVNVQIPSSDLSTHALQMSCLAQEVVKVNGGTNKPMLLGGEFNISENDASYQLLKDGYLSNDKIEELQRKKDVVLPGKENVSMVDLFWSSFQHQSSNLCGCYKTVLDREFFIPELKSSSPDLLWYSSGSLHTVGVLDVASDKLGDRHLSLKADIAFSQ